MSKSKNKAYEEYRCEFRELRESGLRLYCPEGVEISPGKLAKTILSDPDATYMRDMIYDGEGRPVKVNFIRVNLKENNL